MLATDLYVKIFSDNASVVAYITMGGQIRSLHDLTRQIWEWCIQHNCTIEAFHIPRKSNIEADYISRNMRKNLEWKLHPTLFTWICQILFTLI